MDSTAQYGRFCGQRPPNFLKKDNVYDFLKARILSQEYPPRYKFPSEPAFAKELGVGRITLRSAMEKLERAGLVARLHGKGTYVSPTGGAPKRLKKILLLIGTPMGSIEAPNTYIVPSMIRHAEQMDFGTDILTLDFLRSLPEEHALKVLTEIEYNGVMLGTSHFLGNEKEVKILQALNKPVVIPHSKPTDGANTGFATMHADYKQAWIDGVRHLVRQGYKDIMTIGADSADSGRALRGFAEKEYLDFLAAEGANPDPSLLFWIPFNFSGLTKMVADVMRKTPPPTAIMCFSDFYAMNVYDSLRSLSLRIPQDVAVMGYCGYPGAHMMSPPLSTVDFDYAGIGERALEILGQADEWFGKSSPPPHIISPHKLIARESTERR